jgi:hypothetical protein
LLSANLVYADLWRWNTKTECKKKKKP